MTQPEFQREFGPADSLILDFWLPELREYNSVVLRHPVVVLLLFF